MANARSNAGEFLGLTVAEDSLSIRAGASFSMIGGESCSILKNSNVP